MSEKTTSSRFKVVVTFLAVFALLSIGFLMYKQKHNLQKEGIQRKAEVQAGPRVHTFLIGAGEKEQTHVYQGESLPKHAVTIYAKITGYLKEIYVDKGTRVKKGQLLATIESPETERQTKALKATYDNLQRVADRYKILFKQKIATEMDTDNAAYAAITARENWLAQKHTEGYEKVFAPFSGTVTARFVDPGAFIQDAVASTASQQLLIIADVERLKVSFYLDQSTAALARVGHEVSISPAEQLNIVRKGRISRLAGALDLRTRTMVAEVDLDNHDGLFLGGGYVRVSLKIPKSSSHLEIPAEALLMKGEKSFVAVLDGNRLHLQSLVLGDDIGNRVRVLEGLKTGSRIIMNPNPGLMEGDKVQVVN